MEIVRSLDEWLMTWVFEPFAWRSMCYFRLGHPQLARMTMSLSFFAMMLKPILSGDTLAVIVAVLCIFSFDLLVGRQSELWASAASRGSNPLRGLWFYRLILASTVGVVYAVVAIASALTHKLYAASAPTAFVFAVATIYFTCCNPMPPPHRRYRYAFERRKTHGEHA